MTILEPPTSSQKPHRLKWAVVGVIAVLIILLAVPGIAGLSHRGGKISLTMSGMKYSEVELHARAGRPLSLELNNVDGYPHAFDLDEYDIHVEVPGNATQTMTFTPAEPGAYPFYCSVYGHREAGMLGTLFVDP